LVIRYAEKQRGIVLDLRFPEMRAEKRGVQRKRACEPVNEIEKMHSLIDELSAA